MSKLKILQSCTETPLTSIQSELHGLHLSQHSCANNRTHRLGRFIHTAREIRLDEHAFPPYH